MCDSIAHRLGSRSCIVLSRVRSTDGKMIATILPRSIVSLLLKHVELSVLGFDDRISDLLEKLEQKQLSTKLQH